MNGRVVVGERAEVDADISASTIVVGGKVRGNLNATGRVEILPQGILTGNLKSGSFSAADGALVKGRSWSTGVGGESRWEVSREGFVGSRTRSPRVRARERGELLFVNGSRIAGELSNEALMVSTGSGLVEIAAETWSRCRRTRSGSATDA